ncbi:MAG TPA: hypothetical protein VFW98_08305 [Gemmatimonadaceae bacterium]|nr:hypothetical protein [Gemmatimonadaceae bacterium]
MTLQTSGRISIGDIRTEKGVTSGSLTTLSTTSLNPFSASGPDGVAPHGIAEFYGYHQTSTKLDAPTVEASWNDGTQQMDVLVTAGVNNPPDTTYVISASGTGTGGTMTGPGTFHDGAHTADGTQSCYTAQARHDDFAPSDASNQSCAARGQPQ